MTHVSEIMELYKKTYQENAHRFSFSLHSYYRMEHCRTCYWHTFMPDNCYEPSGSTHRTFMHPGYAGLIPGFFSGIFFLYKLNLKRPAGLTYHSDSEERTIKLL